jgi:hypothetical protein
LDIKREIINTSTIDPSGLTTLQIGLSAYFNFRWFSFQVGGGLATDLYGNAGYYGNFSFGPAVGGGFKLAANAAVTGAPRITDLNGQGSSVNIVAGTGTAGSIDYTRSTTQAGQIYSGLGISLGRRGFGWTVNH